MSGIARSTCVGVPTVMLVTYWTEKKFSIGTHMLGAYLDLRRRLGRLRLLRQSECIADGAGDVDDLVEAQRRAARCRRRRSP